MQLFIGVLIGAVFSLLFFKYNLSKNCGHLKICKNDCPFYHRSVDLIKSEIAMIEYLKDNPDSGKEIDDGEEVEDE